MSNFIEVGSVRPRVRYEGNGEQTNFHFPFKVFSASDVDVYIDDTLQKTDYLINLEQDGGTVIFDVAPKKNTIITLHRNLDFKRTTNFQEVGPFRTSKVNLEFDYQLACMEQLQDNIDRTVTFPPYAPTMLNISLPMPEPGKAIIWNETSNSLINSKLEIDKFVSQYDEVMKNSQNVSENTDIVLSKTQEALKASETAVRMAENVKNRSETIYTNQKDLGKANGDLIVTLEADFFEYAVTAEGNINFTFDFSNVDLSRIITFALNIKQSDNHTYSYNFGDGTNFTWLDEIAATPKGSYLLTFRRYPNGKIIGTPIGQMS